MPLHLPLSASALQRLAARTARNSEWAAAVHILTSARFATDPRVWRHVDEDLSGIGFTQMLAAQSWSSGERLLLELAASLYGTGVQVDAGRLLGLGDSGRAVAYGAVVAYLAAE